MNRDHEPHPHTGRLVAVIVVSLVAWAGLICALVSFR
jgi:hypothetical protein